MATSRETSLTLERGLTLLHAVAGGEVEAPTVSDLAVAIGVSRAAVYRLLVPLEERGLIRRTGPRVRLGMGVLALAAQVLPQLRAVATPTLRALAEQVGATAHLTVADGGEAQAVAVVEPSWTDYHIAYRVGTRHQLQQGAAGRAVLLHDGWVISSGELEVGACGVAAPVRGVPGLLASVGVVALQPIDADEVGPQVQTAATALAKLLTA